ncbi:MAG: disulfide bond formation protein B [Pseudomonadota bacterium]
MMTVYGRMLLAASASVLVLIAALAFQYLGGFEPCEMCLWQRWPHLAAVVVGALGITVLWRVRRLMAGIGTLAMAVSAGLALLHVGVEQGWWEGFTACATSLDPAGMSAEDFIAGLPEGPVTPCTDPEWFFLGLSMAAWNGLISLGLAVLWGASVVWWRMPFDREI